MASNFYVYKHISPNNKVYIGITSQNPNDRWFNGDGYNKQKLFYRAIQKYGWDNFQHEILFENLSKEEACQKEIELIAEYKSNNPEFGYNLTSGGEGPSGYHHTKEAKIRIGQASKGNQYGKGYKHTPEALLKISASSKNRKRTTESIEKWKISHAGFRHSEEAKQKMSLAKKGNTNRLGKHHSAETKRKISEHSKGKIVSKETREKLRQSALKQWQRYKELKREENINE